MKSIHSGCFVSRFWNIACKKLFVLTHSRLGLAHTGPVFPYAGVTRCRGSKANISIFLCWLIYKIQDINIIFCPQSQFFIAAGRWDTERARELAPVQSNGHRLSLYYYIACEISKHSASFNKIIIEIRMNYIWDQHNKASLRLINSSVIKYTWI